MCKLSVTCSILAVTILHSFSHSLHAIELLKSPAEQKTHRSFIDVLQDPQQYAADVERLAHIAEVAHLLSWHTRTGQDPFDDAGTQAMIYHISRSCSGQLESFSTQYFIQERTLSPEETAALKALLHACKTTVHLLAEPERAQLCLSECAASACPAARHRSPVRDEMIERIANHRYPPAINCCFFASGYLATEYALLRALSAHTQVSSITLVDTCYYQLLKGFNVKKGPFRLYKSDISDTGSINATDFFARLCQTNIDMALSALFEYITYAHAIEEFKTRAYKLFPKLEHIVVYAHADDLIKEHETQPVEKFNLLIGCDFFDPSSAEFDSAKQRTWDHFHNITHRCLSGTGVAWSLTTARDATFLSKTSQG